MVDKITYLHEKEFTYLKNLLKNVIDGKGKTVFISGETGVGKSYLVNNLRKYTEKKNIPFLSGECDSHTGEPFLPFTILFSSIGDELFSWKGSFTTVEQIFLMNNAGVVLAHETKAKAVIDKDIVGGMLTAVQDFVKDSFGRKETKETLEKLEYGNIKILMEHGEKIFLVTVISGNESPEIRIDMKNTVKEIEQSYSILLDTWDGDISKVSILAEPIRKFTTKKYFVEQKIDSKTMQSEQIKIFDAVYQKIHELSQKNGLVIHIGNIQWIDSSSIQLIHYLAKNIDKEKVMICCTYIPEDLKKNKFLTDYLVKMHEERVIDEIVLSGISKEETPIFIDDIIGRHDFSDRFVNLIWEKTDGNLFFMRQVINALMDEGVIYRDKRTRKWKIKDIVDIEIPPTIRDMVFRRIDILNDDEKELLKYASVIGREFEFDIIKEIFPKNEEEIATLLEKLISHGILSVNNNIRFTHFLTVDALYNNILKFKRKIIHKKIGYAIEKIHNLDIDKYYMALAYHFMNGGVYDKAIAYSIRAGDKSRAMYSFIEAVKYYNQTLDALNYIEDNLDTKRTRISVLNKLWQSYFVIGEWDNAIDVVNQCIPICIEINDDKTRSLCYRNIARIYENRSQWNEALNNYEKSLHVSIKAGDIEGVAEAQKGLGWIHWRKGEYQDAIEHYTESIAKAEKMENMSILADCYITLGSIYNKTGKPDIAIDYLNKSLKLLEKQRYSYQLARVWNTLGAVYYEKKDYDKSLECFTKCVDIARRIGDIRVEAYGLSNIGEIYAKKNESDRALGYCDKALIIFRKLDEKFMIAKTYQHYGIIFRTKKDYSQSEKYFRKSISIFERIKTVYDLAQTYYEFGLLYHEIGNEIACREYMEKALKIYRRIGAEKNIREIESLLNNLK